MCFYHFIETLTHNWKKNENIFSLFPISEISLRNWFLRVESDSEINSKEMKRKEIIIGGTLTEKKGTKPPLQSERGLND